MGGVRRVWPAYDPGVGERLLSAGFRSGASSDRCRYFGSNRGSLKYEEKRWSYDMVQNGIDV